MPQPFTNNPYNRHDHAQRTVLSGGHPYREAGERRIRLARFCQGWLDFVNHHSAEWQEEYLLYCKENDFLVGDPSAEEFVHFKDRELEYALENGDA